MSHLLHVMVKALYHTFLAAIILLPTIHAPLLQPLVVGGVNALALYGVVDRAVRPNLGPAVGLASAAVLVAGISLAVSQLPGFGSQIMESTLILTMAATVAELIFHQRLAKRLHVNAWQR